MGNPGGTFKQRLLALREEYRKLLPAKIEDLEATWLRVAAQPDQRADLLAEAYRKAHSLAGSGTTFGYSEISDIASEMESYIKDMEEEDRVTEDHREAMARYLTRLRRASGAGETPAEPEVPEAPAKPTRRLQLLYWLGLDDKLAEEAARGLSLFGFKVICLEDLDSLRNAMARKAPDLLIFDLAPPEGMFPGLGDVFALMGEHRETRILCIMPPETDHMGRLEVIRAGADMCLTKPVAFDQLVARLDRLAPAHREPPYRLMIVDDDAILAKNTATILERAGMVVSVITDPFHALDELPAFEPDLILMDLHMPQCSGTELARLIRENPRHEDLVIVYLSKETELSQQIEALEAGAEDFIFKPVKYRFLYHALACRIRRARLRTAGRTRDNLTGLLNHTAFQNELTRRVAVGAEKGSRFVLAFLDVDHFHDVNETHGHEAGDRVLHTLALMLRRGFGHAVVLSRFHSNTFAVILPNTSEDRAREILDHLRNDFSGLRHRGSTGSFTATLSIGVVAFPQFSSSIDLIEGATRALTSAKGFGRNKLLTMDPLSAAGEDLIPEHGESGEEPVFIEDEGLDLVDENELDKPVDLSQTTGRGRKIVVVDDDRQVLAVISSYLDHLGFRVWGGVTGDEGYALVKEHRPDLVLVDLLLFPGIHGFELCKMIKGDTSLEGIKVILMTAVYKDYRYRLEGQEAGGDAFIIKPIDFDELMTRIEELLGDSGEAAATDQ